MPLGIFIINWIPYAVFAAFSLSALFIYFRPIQVQKFFKWLNYKNLIIEVIGFNIVIAGLKTALQYFAWMGNELSRLLLPPHQSISYFFQYVFTHFWLGLFISWAVSFLFYFFLLQLNKKNERFFEKGEPELGLLMALLVGWPYFVIFVPLIFLIVVIFSVANSIFRKESYVKLGAPFILAGIFSFIGGAFLMNFFKLGLLAIG